MQSSQQILSVLYTKPSQVQYRHTEGTEYHRQTYVGEVHVFAQVPLQALTNRCNF
jgi:hypothetical protein